MIFDLLFQLVGVTVTGLEPEFQPIANYLLPNIVSHKQDCQDIHLQVNFCITLLSSFHFCRCFMLFFCVKLWFYMVDSCFKMWQSIYCFFFLNSRYIGGSFLGVLLCMCSCFLRLFVFEGNGYFFCYFCRQILPISLMLQRLAYVFLQCLLVHFIQFSIFLVKGKTSSITCQLSMEQSSNKAHLFLFMCYYY